MKDTSKSQQDQGLERQNDKAANQERTTLNLDTGKEERLPDPDEESTMDFAPGSDGGSAADGGEA